MLDKILATISVMGLALFIGIVVVYVREIDLTIICTLVVLMAMVDFVLLNRKKPEKDPSAE